MQLIISFIGFFIAIVFGFYILFAGRKILWATLGIIALSAAGNLLAVLVADLENSYALIQAEEWLLIGIAFAVGILGAFIGRSKPDLAVYLIGFISGADVAIWIYEISTHLITRMANQSENLALWVGITIIVVGGMLGLWLVKALRDEALIFVSMIVGASLIQDALGLNTTSSWTAIIILALSLAGVLVQYAMYLREIKAEQTEPEPHASSMAYFQDLELH